MEARRRLILHGSLVLGMGAVALARPKPAAALDDHNWCGGYSECVTECPAQDHCSACAANPIQNCTPTPGCGGLYVVECEFAT